MPSFNSSMVRLGVDLQAVASFHILFQFQYGAIGSRSTTQKKEFIINELPISKIVFFCYLIVDHPN